MKPTDTELVACRVPADFKQQLIDYAYDHDLSVSQLIRKGLKLVVGQSSSGSAAPARWLVS